MVVRVEFWPASTDLGLTLMVGLTSVELTVTVTNPEVTDSDALSVT